MRRTSFTYPVTSLAGSTPGNIIKLLKIHKTDPKYYFKIALSFLVALIFSPINLYEKLKYNRQIRNFHFEEAPLFIIGFNRSGTTLLHNLLCQDSRAGYTTTFQTVFPHCVLTQGWWMKPLINHLVPANRPFDNVSMDMGFPQEEEFALSNLQLFSVYNFLLFPSEFDTFIDRDYFTGLIPARDLDRWKKEYRRMVIKSLLNTKGSRYISKNPHNIPRTEILRELFPGCRFIFIYRDPYVVVESLYNFILAIFPGVQLQKVPPDFSRKNIARFYSVALNHYFEMKEKAGSPSILEIKMEDFMKDKIGTLRSIYTTFGLKEFEKMVPAFEVYLARHPSAPHETNNIHEETIHYVNLYASEIVARLGYPVRI
jgi:omega-hydroxy-beta-dihydromenaquinone-9 sulfotransferase